ncbi:efflux RND transporter periplasmic adaptor subunit [Teichococcus vastitatis]|uniref:Efflux RND transporter periplasmic adaptor subunit n=1 Tax=Teichococcus vastitatis TaxID=2307076 RepID=A0ABS9VZZ8_9PROT|nr:efflux RND transporter periplasmic adaptor subunit [Pseudoroseomonas vastitatis]MCI0752626.1 efflux RND transporter periplasmic adaptor subunit [Pseudoroseomonas vastitatis]
MQIARSHPWLLAGALGVGLVAVALPSLSPHAQETPARRPAGLPVVTRAAERGPMPLEITANGNVMAEATVAVRSRVEGQMRQVHVQEGQRVKRGDVLFTLDARMAEAQLAQQEAQAARDRAQAVRARQDAVRYTSLRGEGFAAQQRLEQAQADAAAAEATVRATEAQIAQTRITLGYATIRAELDGRLGAIPATEGNLVRAGDTAPLATITQTDPIQVQFAVPERWLPEIQSAMRQGQPTVTAHPPGDHKAPVEGRLFFVDSQVDATSGTIQLKARFANPQDSLWPGQYVNVVLVPRVEPDALSVPVQAVQTGSGGERYVYVVDSESRARRRAVALQRVVSGRAVLEAEIAAGDKVVVEGAQLLSDGARVTERGAARPQS